MMHVRCSCGEDHPACTGDLYQMNTLETTLDVEKITCPLCLEQLGELGIDIEG